MEVVPVCLALSLGLHPPIAYVNTRSISPIVSQRDRGYPQNGIGCPQEVTAWLTNLCTLGVEAAALTQ